MKVAPQRTCLVCRRTRPRPDLMRIARSVEGGVKVDAAGRAGGRGAYVCRDDGGCRRAATRKRLLDRALRRPLTPDDLARLATEIQNQVDKERSGT